MVRAVPLPTITDDSALGGAVIEKSLVFNNYSSSADDATLTRTVGTTSNRRTFTHSFWVKRTKLGYGMIFGHTDGAGSYFFSFVFNSDNKIEFNEYRYNESPSNKIRLITTRVFRDTTSWYHIVTAVDTTQGTSSNRVKIYVNGVQETDFGTEIYCDQNHDTYFNSTSPYPIMRIGLNGWGYGGANCYLAEFHAVDGNAYDPSYFGFTESQTNVWMPKRYGGTYGTNGYYLNFSTLGETATTMGLDRSGNNNNFTPTNLEISDFSLDTPSNTFATLNPLSTSVNTLTQGNLYSTGGGASWRPVVSDMAMSSGRWYWEIYIDTVSSYQMHGIRPQIRDDGDVNHDNDYYPGTRSDEWAYEGRGYLHNNASPDTSWGDTYAAGDILGFALDMDAGTLNIYKNGSSTGSQITGISAVHSPSGSRGSYQACFCPYGSNSEAIVNFGQDGTFAGHKSSQNNKDINGIGDFYYSVPTGFKAICAANFRGDSSYIINPKKHFDVVTWTGNNTAGRLIPLGFKPDFVWVKCRTAGHDHQLTDSVRGSSKALRANAQASEEDWDVLYSGNNKGMGDYVDGGFILDDDGNNARYNNTGQTYVAWCWKGGGNSNTFNIDGTGYGTASAAGLDGGTIDPTGASVNTKAKFSVLTYTGNGSDGATVEHGLGSIPVFVIVKKRTGDNWMVYHQANNNFSSPENYYLELNENSGDINADTLFNNTAPTSSVFSLDDDSSVNSNSGSFVAYC